jgi:phosphoadenosine phosphosulfate reductase
LEAAAHRIAAGFAALDLPSRLEVVRDALPGRIVLTTSFGIEAQAIAHAIFTGGLDIEVVTLDTGRLFPETYMVWAETERRYRCRIPAIYPQQSEVEALVARQGIDGFRTSVEARHRCCFVRKVEPLGRALAGASGWITGLRAEQSSHRATADFVSVDAERRIVKINPLLDWRRADVADYVRGNDIPYNVLHDRGFPSIGCAPCARAVHLGEPERAGRWWWERDEKRECGLHLDGTPRPDPVRDAHTPRNTERTKSR